ncbi:TetR/AcrR family transcriptional regulator [Nocardiopsis alba]|uniref:TetR/AcrR family transcriptional regulator n=1 Tax=Nocardiopsis alba TaxID=53437 RepID=UPI0003482948|nr:TetR/AcrR family transcriptional regulator [Nocardiopsis alba]
MSSPRGEQVRQRLLAAATELIGERGWSAVSTRALAERAELTPGLVHYHFSSLNALLEEAALATVRAMVDRAAALMEQTTPRQGVEAMLLELEGYPGDDPTSRLFLEAYLAAGRDAGLREGLARLLADFRERTARWLERSGVPEPEATARVLAATVDGLMLHRPLDPEATRRSLAPVLDRLIPEQDRGEERR